MVILLNPKRSAVCAFILCLSPALFASYATASPSGDAYRNTATTAREAIWKTIASGGGNAATVAVMDGGRIVYSECFGPAERAANRPVNGNTRFNIGSTSKVFAAVAILLLADDGKLAIDDPVAKHIPEFVMRDPRYRDITIRMLFNHSSGLPGSTFTFGYRVEGDPHAVLLETLRDCGLKHAPGAMGIYCNDGFTLAEMIVERLSGKRFVDFLAERVFGPLGMENTGPSVGEWNGDVAEYYDEAGRKHPHEVVQVHGAGGLSSTAEDLCRFLDSFAPGGKHILSDASVAEILKRQTASFTQTLRRPAVFGAFGWDYAWLPDFQANGLQVLGKSGGTGCYSTNLQVIPARRMAVALSVSGQVGAEALTYRILSALLADRGLPAPGKPPRGKPADPQPIPSELLPFAGYYVNADRAVQFSFDRTKHTLDILPLKHGSESVPPLFTLVHNGGFFHDNRTGDRYYLLRNENGEYLVRDNIPRFGADGWAFQKLETIRNPGKLSVDMDGTVWLRRNVSPFEQVSEWLIAESHVYGELPGYLTFFGVLKIEGPDFAGIAATGFRDQAELKLFRKNGEIRAKTMQFVYSPARSARGVTAGKNEVAIGTDGENEWRTVDRGAVLSFAKPENGRVIVLKGPNDPAPLYDSVVDAGETYVPEGSFILLGGRPGDAFEITVR